jgi:hypothetical protein
MTTITYTFSDYPARPVKKKGAFLMVGEAGITLSEGLVVIDDKSGIWQVPLQRRLRWTIDDLRLPLKTFDEEDVKRFLRGRHSCRIERRLYSAFFAEKAPDRFNPWKLTIDGIGLEPHA